MEYKNKEYKNNIAIGLGDEIGDLKAVQKKYKEIIEELSDMLDDAGREIGELRAHISALKKIIYFMGAVMALGGFTIAVFSLM